MCRDPLSSWRRLGCGSFSVAVPSTDRADQEVTSSGRRTIMVVPRTATTTRRCADGAGPTDPLARHRTDAHATVDCLLFAAVATRSAVACMLAKNEGAATTGTCVLDDGESLDTTFAYPLSVGAAARKLTAGLSASCAPPRD